MNKFYKIGSLVAAMVAMLSLGGARGGCTIHETSDCPDLHVACPDLECPQGFQVNKDSCAVCACIGEPAPQPMSCDSDRDCMRGQHCEIQVSCVEPMDYDEDSDAVGCERFDSGVCVDNAPPPVECSSDRECIEGRCEFMPECFDDVDCPEGMVCAYLEAYDENGYPHSEGGVCVPVEPECECQRGFHCEMEQVECFAEPCPPQPVCVPDDEFCYSDSDCPEGTFCAMSDYCDEASYCGGVCLPSEPPPPPSDCQNLDEQRCIENPACEPQYIGWGCVCAGCEEGEDCPPCDCPDPAEGEDYAGCAPVNPCVDLSQDQCEASPLCDVVRMPTGVPCECDCDPDDANCICEDCEDSTMGWACVPANEPPPPGDECYDDADCPEGMACVYTGFVDEDGDGFARGGFCVPVEPPPGPCEGLDERSCVEVPECAPVYVFSSCGCSEESECDCPSYHDYVGCESVRPPEDECYEDVDCPDGMFCALMDCAQGMDCGGGGVCMPREEPPVVECRADADCPEGMMCISADPTNPDGSSSDFGYCIDAPQP